ncbi:carbohydrate ABC transporter permease [Microcella alkaliphila]|uniref:Binding-protein-dependent transport systems inner membrane component n=1 Tax=Microcella alkaliphila TaxID=279828 RepID=A0A0U5BAZ8_9MICO|nr:sugar ABC transporter permease [Microcella alkaliphila]BAU32921.1 binding-protein-dependent transport systems inner membrane component [Microcella alkaliphila]
MTSILPLTEPAIAARAATDSDDASAPPAAPRRTARGSRARRVRYALTVLAFLLPSAIPLTLFVLTPMVSAAWISLHDWNLLSPMTFVGLDNFAGLIADPDTARVFGNTISYIVGYLPLVYIGGLALALGLNRAMRGRNLLRGIYFLPVVTSWIVVAIVWRWLLAPENGVVNGVLGFLGIDGPGWWTDPSWSMPSIILASAWKDLGFVMVILLAGLQSINTDLYDAAKVDGAGPWRRLISVTLPMLSPSTFFVVVISLINGFQVFDQVYAMTGGGPAGSSQVVVGEIYDLTFRYGSAGEASALSWMLFVVILAVTVVQVIGQRRWVHYA